MSKNYINNKELYYELICCKSTGRISRKLEKMFLLIIDGVMKKFYYNNPDDRFDCYQESAYQVFRNWYKFDEERGNNALAYISEVAKRGFGQGYNKLIHKKTKGLNVMSLDFMVDGKTVFNL